ncbi:helix-turn-helix domain-containing protein [Streptomyces canus]|uniref:helix-turn-helix domain-containing protein n=1 Tax=Streptomyces canus TaxID=58343 RepID=UPI0022527CC8|nr:helix-turn-helix transcriptional regulator [Streptomyces canus]MCX4862367.1 helix-turn-helix domain-containing protein [Streptomyces canus]
MIDHPPTALPRDLLADEEMQRALAEHDFGRVFRLARERAGLSYSRIAAECDIKPERVGSLARGRGRITTFAKIVEIADALRVPGHLVGLAPRPWETKALPAHMQSKEIGTTVRRRSILQAATTTGLAAALPALHSPAAPAQITSGYVDQLRARTARLRRLDDILGGGDTYRVYLSEYQRTKQLLRTSSASDETRRGLLGLISEQAQQAGWAAFDGGQPTEAASLYEESMAAARDAGDGDLLGNALAFLAYQTADRDQAAEIAARGCASITSQTPAGVRALLYERLAWACAAANRPTDTERALTAARAALEEQGQDEAAPDWAAWVDDTELDIMAGRCWTELRRPLRAVPVLTAALARYDDIHARDKALYLSWLADALLSAGEVEEAARVTGNALDLAVGVASVRPRKRLAPVINQLGQYRQLPAVRDALERMGA